MSNNLYTAQQFAEREQQLAEERAKARGEDRDVQAARATLAKSEKDLQDLQAYIVNLPMQRRLQFNGNVVAAKQAIADAQKAVRVAENAHIRSVYLAKLEERKKQQEQAQEKAQVQFASEQEAAAKGEMKTWYLSAGGLEAQFEQAWPDLWAKELEQRAAENLAGAKRQMQQARGYLL